jgi:glucose/arabinose transport system substrate-binding protein
MGSRSLSSATLAAIVIVIVVVAAVGGYLAFVSTRHHVTTTTLTVTVTTPITTTSSSTTTTSITTIYFYTWWATDGKIALNHVINAFEAAYPQYVVSPEIIPGAGGTNAKFVVLGMMAAGKPPAAFQTDTGPLIVSYVLAAPNGARSFVNFTPIMMSMHGLWDNVIPAVVEASAYNGTMPSAPIDLERGALLFINIKLLREYNLPLPTNLSTLIYDTVQLAQHGVTPWMVPGADGGWDQLNLWQDIFLSLAVQEYGLAGGARLYNELAYGTIDLANTSIQQLINETDELFLNFTSYDYPGWQSLTWTQGLSDLIEGKVAFQANGDWLTNYAYDFLNTTTYPAIEPYISWPNVTVVVEPFPGTQEVYAIAIGSIGVPAGFPTTQEGVTFAEFFMSYQGQVTWGTWKAVPMYKNATSPEWWSFAPSRYVDWEQAISTPSDQFVWWMPDGGTFADVFGTWISQLLALQEVGKPYIPVYNSQFASMMHEECSEWYAAAKAGFGYLGLSGRPFDGYYPPWVIVSTNSVNTSYVCPAYSLP